MSEGDDIERLRRHYDSSVASTELATGAWQGAKVVTPQEIPEGSWLNEPRFDQFRKAYRYACSRTLTMEAFAAVHPETMYWMWQMLERGVEHAARGRRRPDALVALVSEALAADLDLGEREQRNLAAEIVVERLRQERYLRW